MNDAKISTYKYNLFCFCSISAVMATFSGAIKIADGLEDYLAPSQNCIIPLMATSDKTAPTLGGDDVCILFFYYLSFNYHIFENRP